MSAPPPGAQHDAAPLGEILDAISDAIVALDADWRFTFVNAHAARLFGREVGALEGSRIWEAFPEDVWSAFRAIYERAAATRSAECFADFHPPNSKWIEHHIYPSAGGGLVVLCTDITHQHHALERLRRSERRFHALVDATAQVVWGVDLAGDFVEPITSLEAFTGRTTADIVRDDWVGVIHEDDRLRLRETWAASRERGDTFDLEFRLHRADGEWRLMQGRVVPVLDDAGAIREWVGVNVDITDRRATEIKLRASEARLARAQEIAGIGTWEMDGATMKVVVSDNIWRMHGLDPHSMDHQQWIDGMRPDDSQTVAAAITRALREGVPYRQITRYTRPDGTVFVGEAYAERVVDEQGNVRLLGTLQDVTERVAQESALRESEQHLALIFNNAFDSTFLVSVEPNDEFRLRLVNAAFTRLTSIPASQVVNRELREIANEHDAEIQVDRYRAVAHTGMAQEYEEHYELHGQPHIMETHLVPVTNRAGEVTHILGTSHDISERRRVEKERQALDAQLQHAQKLESLGVLAGGVAHDFNNLLVGILGNASLALLDLEPGTELAEAVGDIEKSARQAAELTNQLLAYSGKGRFVVSALDLARLVTDMSPVWRTALSKRATVTLALGDDLPSVEGDAAQLRQVVLNMMTNASDALGDGTGSIIVRTGVEDVDAVAISMARFATGAQPGEYVYLEVEDDGCGMADETITRIFDPFFTTKFTGRGLGLAATLGIVRGHHGLITVRSVPGEGTVFRIALPARRELIPLHSTPPTGNLTVGSGLVLMVDDEAPVRSAIRRILQRAGYTAIEASGGTEAIAIFRERNAEVDCVVVDLTMPGLDGVDVVHAVRAIRPGVRIVLASGFDAGSVTGLDPAEHVFLHKPFTAMQLLDAVRLRHGS